LLRRRWERVVGDVGGLGFPPGLVSLDVVEIGGIMGAIELGVGERPNFMGVISLFGVVGRLVDFSGPLGTSSALREERSTVSRNDIAASRLTRQ
jgi:hypothetical protein